MRDLIEISKHVLPVANNCPEPTMIQYLREAAIEFCTRSRSWRSEEIFQLINPDQDISLVTCCDSVIHEIESVRWRQSTADQWQEPIDPAAYEDVVGLYQDGNPLYYTQKLPGKLRVAPFTAGELKVVMYLKPDQRAETVPDYIVEYYPQIIADGALGKLLLLPKTDFANPDLAVYHQNRFEAACDRHFRDNLRGQQRARTRTKPSYF